MVLSDQATEMDSFFVRKSYETLIIIRHLITARLVRNFFALGKKMAHVLLFIFLLSGTCGKLFICRT